MKSLMLYSVNVYPRQATYLGWDDTECAECSIYNNIEESKHLLKTFILVVVYLPCTENITSLILLNKIYMKTYFLNWIMQKLVNSYVTYF